MQKQDLQPNTVGEYAKMTLKMSYIALSLCVAAYAFASIVGMFTDMEAEIIAAYGAKFGYLLRGAFFFMFVLMVAPFVALPSIGLIGKAVKTAVIDVNAGRQLSLPESTHRRIHIERPHIIIYKLPGETGEECRQRYIREKEEMTGNRVIIYTPFRSAMIEIWFATSNPETSQIHREKFGVKYIDGYYIADESESDYFAAVSQIIEFWRTSAKDSILSGYAEKNGKTASQIFATTSAFVFALLFAIPSIAGPRESISASLPPSVLSAIPAKNKSVDFVFQKITFSRTSDGKTAIIDLLEKSPVKLGDSETGAFSCLWVGVEKFEAVQSRTPVANASTQGRVTKLPDSISFHEKLEMIDRGGDAALRKIEETATEIAATRTWNRVVAFSLFLAVISQFIARTAFGESRINADGSAIFGRDFYLYGAKFRFLSWAFAVMFLVMFAGQWFYFAYEYDNLTRGFGFFLSREFGLSIVLFLMLLVFGWLLNKWVVNPPVDRRSKEIFVQNDAPRIGAGN
jgi:hypothetical protein